MDKKLTDRSRPAPWDQDRLWAIWAEPIARVRHRPRHSGWVDLPDSTTSHLERRERTLGDAPPTRSASPDIFFSRICRVIAAEPVFCSLPAHTHSHECGPNRFTRDTLGSQPELEAHVSQQRQRPYAGLLAKTARTLLHDLSQAFPCWCVQGLFRGMRGRRTLHQRLQTTLIERIDRVGHRVWITAQLLGDSRCSLASAACQHDLAASQCECFRRSQDLLARWSLLPLSVLVHRLVFPSHHYTTDYLFCKYTRQ